MWSIFYKNRLKNLLTNFIFTRLILNPSAETLPKAVKIANSLNKKSGPFDSVFLLGDIVNETSTNVSLPQKPDVSVYHTEGEIPIEKGEVPFGDSIKYLGKIGILQLASGLKVGYITGRLDDLTENDITESFEGKPLIDILITYQWPSAISSEQKLSLVGDKKIDIVFKLLKPRYCFSCGFKLGRFFERNAFDWNESDSLTSIKRNCRFISLGVQGSPDKWFYAFNISINNESAENQQQSEAAQLEPNPFIETRAVSESSQISNSSTQGLAPTSLPSIPIGTNKKRSNIETEDKAILKKPRVEVTPDKCFFCLSNPKVAIHLIVSIGEFAYVTTTKGPLTVKNKDLNFSGHGLIIPIQHIPTLRSIKDTNDVEDLPVYKEIVKYQDCLYNTISSISKDYDLVFWEISRSKNIHYHFQFLPILSTVIENNFEKRLESQISYNNEKFCSGNNNKNKPLSYIKIETGDIENEKLLHEVINSEDYMLIKILKGGEEKKQVTYLFRLYTDDRTIDLQFPRKVLSFILKAPKRLHWEKCVQSISEESEQAEALKLAMKKFDFTLN